MRQTMKIMNSYLSQKMYPRGGIWEKKNGVEKFRLQLQNRKSKKDPRNTPRASNKEFYQQFNFFSQTWNSAINKNRARTNKKPNHHKRLNFTGVNISNSKIIKIVTKVVSLNGQTNKDSQKPIAKKMRFQHQKC